MSPVFHRLWGRELTRDTFFRGKVPIYQPRQGWRFSVDAPILSSFLGSFSGCSRAVEIGGGCGVISLLLLSRDVLMQVTVYEIQPFYARLCGINSRTNGFSGRMRVICQDFLSGAEEVEPVELVFTNPPFYPQSLGRVSPNREIAMAKWEISLSVDAVLGAVQKILSKSGRLVMILPGDRERDYRRSFAEHSYHVERYRPVLSFTDSKTERFLIQLSAETAVEQRQPPLVIFSEPGVYTDEMSAVLRGE